MRINTNIIQKANPKTEVKESLIIKKKSEDESEYSTKIVKSTLGQYFNASGTRVEIVYDCNGDFSESYAGVKISAHLDDNSIKVFLSKHVLEMLCIMCNITKDYDIAP